MRLRSMVPVVVLTLASPLVGCKSLATGALADALSGNGGALGRDDDPELVADAAPFGLKTMESVLVSQPEHVGLLTALAGGFVQYGAAFVDMPADVVATSDFERSQEMKLRARKLFLRARGYALQGLEVDHEGFEARLRKDATAALAEMEADDVPLLYWTAASWGLAISVSKTDPELIADLPIVQALTDRCIALDPAWGQGTVHELAMSIEMARPGGQADKATKHYEAAVALNGGHRAGTHVSYAETVMVQKQDLAAFKALLDKALAIDVAAYPDDKLANTILQRRARWLLGRVDDLFLGGPEEEPAPEGAPQ